MPMRVLVLGAGFGGLELSTVLSNEAPGEIDVTLIDKGDSFVFGYSKLDVMFGRATADAVKLPYAKLAKPGVRFLQEEILSIDPHARVVATDAGTHEADVLVIALGADYDYAATPGLTQNDEFYSVRGAELMTEKIAAFGEGRAIIGVCGAPYKCPPAPSECALLLHDTLTERGVRDRCQILFLIPFQIPIPPSPDTSAALIETFEERGIELYRETRVTALENGAVVTDDGRRLDYDLFLGVPKHRAPDVVQATGLTVDGYIPVDGHTLATDVPGVFALGDCATVGVPKAGVFAERQARAVARQIIGAGDRYDGKGECWVEFGGGRVGRINVDFFNEAGPRGTLTAPSVELVAEKEHFGSSRRARWFDA